MLRLHPSAIQLTKEDVDSCMQAINRRGKATASPHQIRQLNGRSRQDYTSSNAILRRGPERSRDKAVRRSPVASESQFESDQQENDPTAFQDRGTGSDYQEAVDDSFSEMTTSISSLKGGQFAQDVTQSTTFEHASPLSYSDAAQYSDPDHSFCFPRSSRQQSPILDSNQDQMVASNFSRMRLDEPVIHRGQPPSTSPDAQAQYRMSHDRLYDVHNCQHTTAPWDNNTFVGQRTALAKVQAHDGLTKRTHGRSWSESANIFTDSLSGSLRHTSYQKLPASSPLMPTNTKGINIQQPSPLTRRKSLPDIDAFRCVNCPSPSVSTPVGGESLAREMNQDLEALYNSSSPLEELERATALYANAVRLEDHVQHRGSFTRGLRFPSFDETEASPVQAPTLETQRYTPNNQSSIPDENSPPGIPWTVPSLTNRDFVRPVQRASGTYSRGNLVWRSGDDLVPEFVHRGNPRTRSSSYSQIPIRRQHDLDPEQENRYNIEQLLYERRLNRRARRRIMENGLLERTPPRESSLDRFRF